MPAEDALRGDLPCALDDQHHQGLWQGLVVRVAREVVGPQSSQGEHLDVKQTPDEEEDQPQGEELTDRRQARDGRLEELVERVGLDGELEGDQDEEEFLELDRGSVADADYERDSRREGASDDDYVVKVPPVLTEAQPAKPNQSYEQVEGVEDAKEEEQPVLKDLSARDVKTASSLRTSQVVPPSPDI